MTQGYAVDLTPFLELNTEAINTKLGELGAIYNTTLTQSTYEVTGTAPDQKLVVKLGTPEYGLDMDKLYTQVMDAYSKNTFLVEGECSIIAPDEVDLQSIHDAHYKAPVDASFTEKFEVTEGTDGYGFDVEAAKKATFRNALWHHGGNSLCSHRSQRNRRRSFCYALSG